MHELSLIFEIAKILKETFRSLDNQLVSMELFENATVQLNATLRQIPAMQGLVSDDNKVGVAFVMDMFNTLMESGVLELVETSMGLVVKYNFSEDEQAESDAAPQFAEKYDGPEPSESVDEKGWEPIDSQPEYVVKFETENFNATAQTKIDAVELKEGEFIFVDVEKRYPNGDNEYVDTFKFYSLESAREFAKLNIEAPYYADIYINEVVPTTTTRRKKLN